MQLHPDITAAIDAGALGHLVTINPSGSPQVTMIWVGRDGDDLLVAHLGDGQKMRNVERDPRVAISIQLPGVTGIGLDHYAVLHGSATITAGGPRSCWPSWRHGFSARVPCSRRCPTRRRDGSCASSSTGSAASGPGSADVRQRRA
jgi:PPOX class probable F420-dependent enzyme